MHKPRLKASQCTLHHLTGLCLENTKAKIKALRTSSERLHRETQGPDSQGSMYNCHSSYPAPEVQSTSSLSLSTIKQASAYDRDGKELSLCNV